MRAVRLAAVVAGITLVSAVAGAVAGILGAGLLVAVSDGLGAVVADAELYTFAAGLGAICGVVLGPLGAFGFMRHVTLWRLFAETTVGAALAGAAACLLPIGMAGILSVAASGFLAAGARLAWVSRRQARDNVLPPAV